MISVQSVFMALCLSLVFHSALATYHWPSPQYDALEQFYFEGTDLFGLDIAGVTRNCVHRTSTTTSTVAAEWIRLAYHDMATHSVDDGTGGLDASIFFELDRPENVGAGNSNSVNLDFSVSANKYVSRADIIALGVSWAVASCGGPIIPYKGGRVDALVAGRFGVPEPQQTLQQHTEAFRLQGFSPTEMISLVACGHTVGAVRTVDFPNIVPTADVTFDTTTAYDHAVVSEYLAGTTANPLIVAANQTLASDKRIFGSDGDVTMNSMNSASAFASTCTNLLQRMVNTVPTGVTLTDTIQLIPVKVSSAEITMTGSQLILDVLLRISQPPNVPIPPNRSVKMFWCDRRGPAANCVGHTNVASNPVFGQAVVSPVTQSIGNTLPTYRFAAPITAAASVSKFWFQVNEGDGSPVQTYNNGGSGYVIDQDQVIYLPGFSSFSLGSSGGINYNLVVGVRTGSTPTAATFHAFDKGGVGSGPQTDITVNLAPVTITAPPTVAPGYTTYGATVNRPNVQTSMTADFAVTIGGVVYNVDFKQTEKIGGSAPVRTLSTVTTIPS